MTVRALSFHATYGCKHRGRCCTSGWPIEVDGPEGPVLLESIHGRCVYHDDHATGGCQIHRALGHSALPLACRQFPRQSVHDPRGVSVTLSHYCPTANDLLVNDTEAVAIVDNAPAFPANSEYVGFTADHALPPLLHPQLAMDWESWWTFEELGVSLLAEAPEPLTRLGLAVERAREWTVGSGPLLEHLRAAFVHARNAAVPATPPSASVLAERIADALAAVPQQWRDVAVDAISAPARSEMDDAVTRRYLAAHAFANWTAHQGEGLRTWFRSIETAACLLAHTGDAGRADLLLRHLVDSAALVERWKRAESEPSTPHP